MLRNCAIAALAALSLGANGSGSDEFGDVILAPPPTYHANDVNVAEQLGTQVPLDAPFRTSDGAPTTLGDQLRGDLPTILTFNYSDCPMLCSLQLNGLTAAIPTFADGTPPMKLGQQYRIVTIDLEPAEPLDKLAKMKERYIQRLPEADRDKARAGWSFLASSVPGNDAAIRRVAESVGFHYTYVPERAEWAHPAALIFVSTTGTVTRYVYGIEYDRAVMRESIFKAGISESSTAVGFMNRCYHYDPDANNYSHAGVVALRYAAGGFVVLLIGGIGIMSMMRRRPRSES